MLEQILEARENRASYRSMLEQEYNKPVVTFTINIPNGKKSKLSYSWLCRLAVEEFVQVIGYKKASVLYKEERDSADGPEVFMVVDGDPIELKKAGIEVEEKHSLGRLFDIDISGVNREKLHRPLRKCLICGQDAVFCRVNYRHDYKEMLDAVDKMIEERKEKICSIISQLAIRSMLYEISCTPKPGLVDRDNNGAHRDMNFFTFIDGIAALTPYFQSVARKAVQWCGRLPDLLDSLRPLGVKAEMAMFKATGGINTHKGQIFSLGLACAAAANIVQRKGRAEAAWISEMVKDMTKHIVANELESRRDATKVGFTAGERLYIHYGFKGARGEAAAGFPSAVNTGLPALKEALSKGIDLNRAMVHSLINIMGVVKDTNVIHRGGLEGDRVVREGVKRIIRKGSVFTKEGMEEIKEMDEKLIRMNISPGGAADMLGLSVFLYFIEKVKL